MIFLVAPSIASLRRIIMEKPAVDGVEIRLDMFSHFPIKSIEKLGLPWILTPRSKLREMEKYLPLGPSYVDLQWGTSPQVAERIRTRFPKIKIIYSYHHFNRFSDPDKLLAKMHFFPADYYKIATRARSSFDTLRMMEFVQKHQNVIGIPLGDIGSPARILSPLFGNPWNYAALREKDKTAPGQLTLQELERYRYRKLNSETDVYGLIGDPIGQSPSHVTHNAFLDKMGANAVYVKFHVEPSKLRKFLELAKKMAFFKGFSVTRPHKEKCLPLLDSLSEKAAAIGAVNTIIRRGPYHFFGENTDAPGALDVLESKADVKQKSLLILGAGGAARAIAYEAVKRGAIVTIANRTYVKAFKLAKRFKAEASKIKPQPYDFLINCAFAGRISKLVRPNSCVMDILLTKSSLLKTAEKRQCKTIYGYEMFARQAAYQFEMWLGFPSQKNAEILLAIYLRLFA